MEYLGNKLKKYVNLSPIKIVNKKNKKIISTCIYIPGGLEYNERSIYYFQGLVKSVETFNDIMNKNDEGWIYRIYYDKMFDSGIYKTKKKKKTKKITKKKKKEQKKKVRKLSKKKKVKADKMGSIGNEYHYKFDNSIYDLDHKKMDAIYLGYDMITKKEINYKFEGEDLIRKKLLENEETFKKLIKLYHLFIKKIKDNKEERYNNIELVRYDCPKIKKNPLFLGHPSSFGMFLRFCPLLDISVSMFYSVNSTHPITPQLSYIIDSWMKNKTEKILTICYNTPNISRSSKKYIVEPVEKIKEKIINKEKLLNNEKEFIKIIDSIFELNIINEIFDSELKDKLNNEPIKDKILLTKFDKKLKNDIRIKRKRLSFGKIKICKNKYTYRGEKKDQEYYLKSSDINYSFSELLYSKNYISGLKETIGGGMFGIKKSFPLIEKRYKIFIDFIIYLIENNIQLEYGLDELLLKIILIPDIYVYDNKRNNIKIINLRESNVCHSDALKLKSKKTSFLTDKDDKKIIFESKFYNYTISYYPDFFTKGWLYQVDHFDSRKLYIKDNGSSIGETEELFININLENLCFNSLFISFNEPKKLLLIDKKIDKLFYNNRDKETKKYLNNIYEVLYIQDYNLGNIDNLLKFIISIYRVKVVHPNIILKKRIEFNNSNRLK
tara:strand:- start:3043 stop:5037 length:1995 start_codon:yes stop_codon:yes gene_type:complete